jgi:predicted DNA-binding protein (MmcQ/YjbR family)
MMAKATGKPKLELRAKRKSGPQPKAGAERKAAAQLRGAAQPKSPKGEHPLLRELSQICLSLPETVRRDLKDHADFRVRGKVFAYFLNDHHGDGIISVCCKSALGENVDRASREPARFYLPPYIGPRGWFGLRLDGETVDWSEVRNLLELSYELVAPKRLLLKK